MKNDKKIPPRIRILAGVMLAVWIWSGFWHALACVFALIAWFGLRDELGPAEGGYKL